METNKNFAGYFYSPAAKRNLLNQLDLDRSQAVLEQSAKPAPIAETNEISQSKPLPIEYVTDEILQVKPLPIEYVTDHILQSKPLPIEYVTESTEQKNPISSKSDMESDELPNSSQPAKESSPPPVDHAEDNNDLAMYLAENPKQGALRFQVTVGRGVIPIEGADITVSKTINGKKYIFETATSDQDGLSKTIILPAPDRQLSLSPGEPDSYSTYDARVDYPGYSSIQFLNIPIFEGITSLQSVKMLPTFEGNQDPIIVREYEPKTL